eukprot:jgi/Undpi1/10951/HiC_scaffold_30.g13252.m1
MSAANVEAGTSAAGLLIDGSRALFGGTRAQGLRAGTSRFLEQGWFVGWKVTMALYCIVWAAWWDRGEDIEIRIYLATWTHLIATAYFVISTISALLCMAYISRETPAPVPEGKPKPPPPVKATRSPVPCYFRWLQHVSWVLACLSSMVVMSVYWLAIYDGVTASSVDVSATLLSIIMVADQFLIASEFKIKYAWLGIYYFVVYIFFNVGYYYNTEGDDRLTYEIFDWEVHPGKGCLWVFLILAIFVPGFASFHYFIYRLRERMYVSYKHKIEPASPAAVAAAAAAVAAPDAEAAEEKKPEKPKEEKKEPKGGGGDGGGDKPPKDKEGKKKEKKKESAPPPPLSPDEDGAVYWQGYGPPPGQQYSQPPPPPAAALGPPPAAAPKTSRMQPYLDMLQDTIWEGERGAGANCVLVAEAARIGREEAEAEMDLVVSCWGNTRARSLDGVSTAVTAQTKAHDLRLVKQATQAGWNDQRPSIPCSFGKRREICLQ